MARYYRRRRQSKARRNFAADARKINDRALNDDLRPPEAYRDERLEQEREKLERRLAWAFQRGDAAGVEHIERRLDALADEALTEIDPGRVPGPIERPHWWRPKA